MSAVTSHHAAARVRDAGLLHLLPAVLAILFCQAVLSPVPCLANGSATARTGGISRDGASPVIPVGDIRSTKRAPSDGTSLPPPIAVGQAAEHMFPLSLPLSLPLIQYDPTPNAAEPQGPQAKGVTLTAEEYRQFQEMLRVSGATPSQVGLVNLSMKGSGILIAGLAWILLLVFLRRAFNFWFDEDIWADPYLSTAVVLMLIYCTHAIVKAVVS